MLADEKAETVRGNLPRNNYVVIVKCYVMSNPAKNDASLYTNNII